MIGYKNKRYKYFGYFAAKLDDIVNFIPARITAFLMVFITLSKKGFLYIFKYGNQHASPNAGFPEAALAGIFWRSKYLSWKDYRKTFYWGKQSFNYEK